MLTPDIEQSLKAVPDDELPCDACGRGAPGKGVPREGLVCVSVKVLLKTFRRRVCLECASEIAALIEKKAAQVKRGEFDK